jgi:2-keto-4-pentenoate hydratase/2-oxohepta-3-ene-1,7-dioic acid hydratase in catechol pathway
MRLATIELDGEETAAVLVGDELVPVATLGAGLPTTVRELLDHGLTAPVREELHRGAGSAPSVDRLPSDEVTFRPLYRRARKLWGIGLNYRAHADDLGAPYPEEPASFLKGDHTIIGPGDEIVLPPQSQRVTAEAELGLVFGRHCRDVAPEEALDQLAGVCPVLDQTAEDILQRNPRFLTRSKNFPTFFSFGPALVTIDEVLERFGSLERIRVATVRNGEVHRDNVVADMTFPPEQLVSFHSKVMPMYPGDVISTGTPGATVVEDGDVAECRIEGIGRLVNPVVRRS